MRHLKKGRKFHRKAGQRKSLLKGLAHNLILEGKITTTEAKAKELKVKAEKLITLAKKQNLASLRLLIARLPKKSAEKLYYEIAQKYMEKRGGYLRVIKETAVRKRDASKMATVEFV
ncbi:MAG: 50S ribosomal protein L17 [Patescibacteria group bacterium]|nr:50S ribosomal protein L17 [Patescibacteria group bacterium]